VSITSGGNYIVTPSASDPVQADSSSATPCTGLTGAALTPSFGVLTVAPNRYGYYTSTIGTSTTATQASATGSGTGLTLTTTKKSVVVSGVAAWGSDASSAYATAVTQVNSARASGVNALLYVPSGQCSFGVSNVCTPVSTGAYFFGATATSPAFTTGGGIVTDGAYAVTFYMSRLYGLTQPSAATPLKPLVWWDAPGQEGSQSFDGATNAFSEQFGPSLTGGLTIVGDRTGDPNQTGMAFCGNNYFAEIHNYQFRNLPGTGLMYGCLAGSETVSHNRESRFYNIRGFNSGASPGSNMGSINYAAIDINTRAPAGVESDMDDVEFDNVELFGNHGTGIILHAARGGTQPGSVSYVTFAGRLRVEGLDPDGTPLSGPLIQIGDTAANFDGEVNNVSFPAGLQLVDPYFNSAAILVTSSGGAVNTYPSNITTGPGTVIGGGDPRGNGLDIEYCTNCNFNIQSILSSGINYAQGPKTATANLTLQVPAGATSGWSTNLDATAVINYAALGVSTGTLGGSVPFVMPIPTQASPINPMTGTWTTTPGVNLESGTYFQIGPLTCVDLVAQLEVTSVGTSTSGPITFYLPVKPSLATHDAIAVSQLASGTTYSTGLFWPPTTAGTMAAPTPASQILFVPTPNRFYGEIQFQGSKYNTPALATTLNVPSSAAMPPPQGIQLNVLYTFAINGCYQ
jgi:hypothetical protein